MTIARRAATAGDIPFLMQLRHRTMDAHLVASGSSTSEEEHRERLMYRFECAEILLDDGVPIGLLKLARDGLAWKIIQIQLAPEHQGRGLGRVLLAAVIFEADAAGAMLKLSVLKANPARALYERLGFVVEGESAHEYDMRRSIGRSDDT